jgi:hypothetical protein
MILKVQPFSPMKVMSLHSKSVENFDGSTLHTFLKTRKGGNWSMKMVVTLCICAVYGWICCKNSMGVTGPLSVAAQNTVLTILLTLGTIKSNFTSCSVLCDKIWFFAFHDLLFCVCKSIQTKPILKIFQVVIVMQLWAQFF